MKRSHKRRMEDERAMSAAKRAAGLRYMNGHRMATSDEVAARIAEIPPDDRDLTARLMGDPIPGRSALARRILHGAKPA